MDIEWYSFEWREDFRRCEWFLGCTIRYAEVRRARPCLYGSMRTFGGWAQTRAAPGGRTPHEDRSEGQRAKGQDAEIVRAWGAAVPAPCSSLLEDPGAGFFSEAAAVAGELGVLPFGAHDFGSADRAR